MGPLESGQVSFGDLTVLVGPQATGKSIFLQMTKLLLDGWAIREQLKRFSLEWGGDLAAFLNHYFGEGMACLLGPSTAILLDGQVIDLNQHLRKNPRDEEREERLFYIPAQRVITLRDGLTWPFQSYRFGDPFVLRQFSEKLHTLLQSEFSRAPELFPQAKRLKKEFRDLIERSIFGAFSLRLDERGPQRRILLEGREGIALPYLVWSAGQREFVPLLLGLYWLMPPSRQPRRAPLEWVVIEEPETGLHPEAISLVMVLVLELLHRGYRVCLSTHSPHVLDVVWGLRVIQKHGGDTADVRELFGLPANEKTKKLSASALQQDCKVYYFQRGGTVVDISELDPSAESAAEAGWGGLAEFSGRVGDVVAEVVARRAEDRAAP